MRLYKGTKKRTFDTLDVVTTCGVEYDIGFRDLFLDNSVGLQGTLDDLKVGIELLEFWEAGLAIATECGDMEPVLQLWVFAN